MASLGSPFLAAQTCGRPGAIPPPSALPTEGVPGCFGAACKGNGASLSHSPESLPLGKDPAEEGLLNSFPGWGGGELSSPWAWAARICQRGSLEAGC